MNRRAFLAAIGAGVAVTPVVAQDSAPALRPLFLSSATLAVSDMGRSVAFYERLFGVSRTVGMAAVFDLGRAGRSFTLIPARPGARPAILSYGFAIAPAQFASLAATLERAGFSTTADPAGRSDAVCLVDPDDIPIGVTPANDGRNARRSGKAPLAMQSISHVTLTIRNGARSRDFYERRLGLKVQAMQGQTACFGLADGPDFVAFGVQANSPSVTPGPNHVCFGMNGFDANRVMGILIAQGLEPIEYGVQSQVKPMTCRTRLRQKGANGGGPTYPLGTAELYFNDPDNLMMQIQDVSYCGGSGRNGEICP